MNRTETFFLPTSARFSGSDDDVIFVFTPFLFSHLSTDSVFPTFTNAHIFYDNFIMSETCACVHVCIFMCYVCSCVCPCACGCVTIYFIYKYIFHIPFHKYIFHIYHILHIFHGCVTIYFITKFIYSDISPSALNNFLRRYRQTCIIYLVEYIICTPLLFS